MIFERFSTALANTSSCRSPKLKFAPLQGADVHQYGVTVEKVWRTLLPQSYLGPGIQFSPRRFLRHLSDAPA